MKPEQFQDAMTLLPEELLEPVDALRRKKRFPWKPALTTAACFCLVLGLAFGYANLVAPASMENGAMGEDCAEAPMQEHISYSITASPALLEVVQVEEDHIIAAIDLETMTDGSLFLYRISVKLTFDKLPQIPRLEEGQKIRVYCSEEDYDPDSQTMIPYLIEIVEE